MKISFDNLSLMHTDDCIQRLLLCVWMQRPLLNSMLARPHMPYNANQQNYALALGGHYAAIASQGYPGMANQAQVYPSGQTPNQGNTDNSAQGTQNTQAMNMQMFLRPQSGAMMNQTGLQALSTGRQNVGANPNVRPTQNTPTGQTVQMRPGYLPSQQSVAQQLLSQTPIASHAMNVQVTLLRLWKHANLCHKVVISPQSHSQPQRKVMLAHNKEKRKINIGSLNIFCNFLARSICITRHFGPLLLSKKYGKRHHPFCFLVGVEE